MCSFRVGDKVVCVRDDGLTGYIVVGKVYYVTSLHAPQLSMSFDGVIKQRATISVDGAQNPYHSMKAFNPDRFRPVASRSTDKGMSILRGLLDSKTTDQPVKVTA